MYMVPMDGAEPVSGRPRKLVVAGLVMRRGRVLIAQRTESQAMPLQWEFPGGKVEPGENPVEALVRELREELAIEVTVGRVWEVLFHAYPTFDLVMIVYPCRIVAGEPTAVEVAAFAWAEPDRLRQWDVLSADQPLISRLELEGLPEN